MNHDIEQLDTSVLTKHSPRHAPSSLLEKIRSSMKNPDHYLAWIFWPIFLLPVAVFWKVVIYHGPGAPEITFGNADSQ